MTFYIVNPGDSGALRELGKFYWRTTFTTHEGIGGIRGSTTYPAPLAPQAIVAMARDGFWYTSGIEPELTFFPAGGDSARRVRLPWSKRKVEERDRRDYESDWLATVSESARPRLRRVLSDMPFPNHLPAVEGLITAVDGSVWAAASSGSADSKVVWYLATRDDRLPGRIELTKGLSPLHADAHRLLASQRDSLGVTRLILFSILQEQATAKQ